MASFFEKDFPKLVQEVMAEGEQVQVRKVELLSKHVLVEDNLAAAFPPPTVYNKHRPATLVAEPPLSIVLSSIV